jgi:hypothetical protein
MVAAIQVQSALRRVPSLTASIGRMQASAATAATSPNA